MPQDKSRKYYLLSANLRKWRRGGYSTCPRLSGEVLPQDKQPPFVRHDKLCHRDSCCCRFVKVFQISAPRQQSTLLTRHIYYKNNIHLLLATTNLRRNFSKSIQGYSVGAKTSHWSHRKSSQASVGDNFPADNVLTEILSTGVISSSRQIFPPQKLTGAGVSP